jgi:hypothetical protein
VLAFISIYLHVGNDIYEDREVRESLERRGRGEEEEKEEDECDFNNES